MLLTLQIDNLQEVISDNWKTGLVSSQANEIFKILLYFYEFDSSFIWVTAHNTA